MIDISSDEGLVDKYISENKTEPAVKLLFDIITICAKEKNFSKAESLREKLMEVDPMALSEIIRSAEIIEEEKSGSLDKAHMDIWSGLYGKLTPEESNALFYSMKEVVYDANEPVFKKGDHNSMLYFIDKGELKMVYEQQGKVILLKKLKPGDIAGQDTFFSISVCTTSLLTLSKVKMNCLGKDVLARWSKEIPTLEPKLKDYSLKIESAHDLLKKKGMDRRLVNRHNLSGKVAVQMINASGNPVGKAFRGELSDISASGISFYIKTSDRKNASFLLGRNLNLLFAVPGNAAFEKITQTGTVIGVSYHLFNDYIIHLKFSMELSSVLVAEIEKRANPGSKRKN
ncbi:MAG: cyclic nucleotide-binding domain-containing protein [Desulfobacterales bacterium]|nr:cyclic nucleotide-binding domain-containing protein [Desulfobacterales bacterium]